MLLCFLPAIYYELPLVPAYMGLSEEQKNNISTGINYASATCGIFPDTGKTVVGSNILQNYLCTIGFEKKNLMSLYDSFYEQGRMSLVECPSRSVQRNH